MGKLIGWEIYGWHSFSVTIGIGSVEFQLNKWPLDSNRTNRKVK